MRLISLRKMYRTVFMSARVREHARLNFEAFPRMPDLLVFVLDLRLFRRNWYEMGYHFTVCGQDVTAPSLTVLLILYRRQERLSILRQVRLS